MGKSVVSVVMNRSQIKKEETIVLRNKLLATTLHLGIRCFIHCHTIKWLVKINVLTSHQSSSTIHLQTTMMSHLEIVRELLPQHFFIILHEIRSIELCSYFRGRIPHEHRHYPWQQLGTETVLP